MTKRLFLDRHSEVMLIRGGKKEIRLNIRALAKPSGKAISIKQSLSVCGHRLAANDQIRSLR